MFDWGDKNIDQYIPRKQESYSVSKAIPSSEVQLDKGPNWFHFHASLESLDSFFRASFKLLKVSRECKIR